jgi:hypothetical protein
MDEIKPTRTEYGFELEFPNSFTIGDLYKKHHGRIKQITIRKRVENALSEGLIRIAGKHTPDSPVRGRRPYVFQKVNID